MASRAVHRLRVLAGAALLATSPPRGLAQTPPATPLPPTVGRVVDAATGEPIAGAVLRHGGAVATTDAHGAFRLGGGTAAAIDVTRLGYAPRRVSVPASPGDTLLILLVALPRSLETTIVTAARREQKLKDAVVSTEVIGRREIEASGATDVAAALAGQTGIQLDGGVPSGAGVLLQGLGSRRVLVLVDGQPLVGRVNGTLDLSRLPTGMVERIEIVKGPQSALYGSEAMGGVINLITRRPARRGLEAELDLTGGSHRRRDASLAALGRFADVDVGFDAGHREVGLVPGRDGDAGTIARRWDVAPRGAWRVGKRTILDASSMAVLERQRYRLGQLYNHADNTQLGARAGYSRRLGMSGSRVGATLYHSRFEHRFRRSTTPEPVSGTGERDVQTLSKLDLGGSARIVGAWIDGGVEMRHEAIEAERVQGGHRRSSSLEPFVQGTWIIGRASIVPGVRASWSTQWRGSAVTPRLAALWRPIAPLGLRASVSGGYRAPDFKELYLEFVNAAAGYAVRGNPDLTPERSINVSAGAEWRTDRFEARVSGFHNRFTDFIETVEVGPGEYSYRNIEAGRTAGIDVDGAIAGGWWRIEPGYAWLRARDEAGRPLLGRPSHSARVSAAVSAASGPRLSVAVIATGAAPIARDSGGAARWRDRYVRLDTRIAQEVRSRFELVVAAENLLDQRLGEDWPGFTGRLISVTVRWKPGSEE